jgi:hypothetical protein
LFGGGRAGVCWAGGLGWFWFWFGFWFWVWAFGFAVVVWFWFWFWFWFWLEEGVDGPVEGAGVDGRTPPAAALAAAASLFLADSAWKWIKAWVNFSFNPGDYWWASTFRMDILEDTKLVSEVRPLLESFARLLESSYPLEVVQGV